MSDCRHNAPDREPTVGDVQTQRQQLDEQTREQLVDRLVDCLYRFEGESDILNLDRCLEDLEAAGAPCEDFDVEQSLQAFHERFSDAFISTAQEVKKPARSHRPLVRIAIIAAALCAFAFTAQASGLDILGAIARWTSEQFSFVKEGEMRGPTNESEYGSLLEVLEKWGITEQLSPTQFPAGTEMENVMIRNEKGETLFSASYSLGDKKFFVSIQNIATAPHSEVEINAADIEVYETHGIKHHLMADVKQRKATWHNGPWECYIAGPLSKDDMLMMIDSIYA